MKKPMNKTLVMIGLMMSSAAMAQAPTTPSVTAQITMTRGYTQSILSKLGATKLDRFNESSDYATIGPKLKGQMESALTDFRNAMDILMMGSLTDSLNSYNETFNDTKLPDAEKRQALDLQRKVLEQQILSTSAVYQNEVKRLYRVLPEMSITRFTHDGGKVYAEFENSTPVFMSDWGKNRDGESTVAQYTANFINNYYEGYSVGKDGYLTAAYKNRFDSFLKSVCQSRVCAAGVLQQLSSYLLYVGSYLDRNIVITLADGSNVSIEALKAKAGSLPSDALLKTVTTFTFDASYSIMPLKN